MKKGQANLLLTLAIGAILSVVILGVVVNFLNTEALQSTDTVLKETIEIVALEGNTVNSGVISVEFFGNATQNSSKEGASVAGLINFTRAGVVNIDGANFTSNPNYLIDYTYEPGGFVESSTARRLVTNVPLMLAILILVGIVGFVATRT